MFFVCFNGSFVFNVMYVVCLSKLKSAPESTSARIFIPLKLIKVLVGFPVERIKNMFLSLVCLPFSGGVSSLNSRFCWSTVGLGYG